MNRALGKLLPTCLFCLATLVLADMQVYGGPMASPVSIATERPTLTSIGVTVEFSGDDNGNSIAFMRYRALGNPEWSPGPIPFKPSQKLGGGNPCWKSIAFNLRPATQYEFEVRVVDPDGTDQVLRATAKTRSVPIDPTPLRSISVSTDSQFRSALAAARPGDVISLASGNYTGPFEISTSGTAAAPIVIRAAEYQKATIYANCASCQGLTVRGSFTFVRDLSFSGTGAVAFDGPTSAGNVLTRAKVTGLTGECAIRTSTSSVDMYIADNFIDGTSSRNALFGIAIAGVGHVIAHNKLTGFQKAIHVTGSDSRSIDVVGNDIVDASLGIASNDAANVTITRNRITNSDTPLAVSTVLGPVYVLRNGSSASFRSELSLEPTSAGTDSQGVFVVNNTFLVGGVRLRMSSTGVTRGVVFANNLMVSGVTTASAVDWPAPVVNASFAHNGYYPDGAFRIGDTWAGSLLMTHSGGREAGSRIVDPSGGLATAKLPVDQYFRSTPQTFELFDGAQAIDNGLWLPGFTTLYAGRGPDIGAVERGCPTPTYGPRVTQLDEVNEPVGCAPPAAAMAVDAIKLLSGAGTSAYNSLVPERLRVSIFNAGLPVSGKAIVFLAPDGFEAPTLRFNYGRQAIVTSDVDGSVLAPDAYTNHVQGQFDVTAWSGGAWPAIIRRQIVDRVAVSLNPVPATVPAGSSGYKHVQLSVTLTAADGTTVPGGIVEFACSSGQKSIATVERGKASAYCDIQPWSQGSLMQVPVIYRGYQQYTDAVGSMQITVVAPSSATTVSDDTFVRVVYWGLLSRNATSAESAYWAKWIVDNKASRAAFVAAVFNSEEFQRSSRFAAGLYVGILNRDPEYSGWVFQRAAIVGGFSQLVMVTNFLSSEEFRLQTGNRDLSPSDFVQLLYKQILLRRPTPAELAFQVSALESGFSRPSMASAFLSSQEFWLGANNRLNAYLLYSCLLGRAPSLTELQQTAALLVSSSIESAATALIGGSEFAEILRKW